MMPPPETCDLARRLLAYEAAAGQTSSPAELAFFSVHEKLRRSLGALAGVAGFHVLASRALTLARSDAPVLSVVQITADGSLERQDGHDPHVESPIAEAGVFFIAHLLGLLLVFIGRTLTLQLLHDVWPDAALDNVAGWGEKREHTR